MIPSMIHDVILFQKRKKFHINKILLFLDFRELVEVARTRIFLNKPGLQHASNGSGLGLLMSAAYLTKPPDEGPGAAIVLSEDTSSEVEKINQPSRNALSLKSCIGVGCKDENEVLTRFAPSNESQIQVIEWNMMDKSKFFPLSMVSSFTIRTLMHPLTLVKTKIQVIILE